MAYFKKYVLWFIGSTLYRKKRERERKKEETSPVR